MLIYVLDDDRLEPIFWREVAREHNSYVLGFSTALAYRQAVMERQPDVAILDLVMPNETGDEVCKWTRVCYPDVKVYICTGVGGDEFQVLAEQCGAAYIPKTLTHRERMEVVHAN